MPCQGLIAEADGRYQEAAERYQAALIAAPDDTVTAQRIDWLRELLSLETSPVTIPAETLVRYAGGYGPRRLIFEDGQLHYQREGRPKYRLIPLSPTLFALEGIVDFRLEVVLGDRGLAQGLVGHYLGGPSDESPSDPPNGG